ncbi:MAG: PHP domain-containing protein [Planctomycetota bacterium]
MRLKTVIHVHTHYSYDANAAPAEVLETAGRQGVDVLAITDHDTIAGALEARDHVARRAARSRASADGQPPASRPVRVIVGEEISARDGHVIGLFLRERVPPRLPAEETARRIRAQGGVVLVPHPACRLCEASLSYAAVQRLLPWLDGLEVCNAQNPLLWEAWRAARFARRHGVTAFAGADTHLRGYLAGCWQELTPFDGPETFKVSLQQAVLRPGRFAPGYFLRMGAWHAGEKLTGQPLAGCGAAFHRSHAGPAGVAEPGEP